MLDPLPSLHCFGRLFFYLQSPCHPVAPCAIPPTAARIRRSSPVARRGAASHRIYGTYGGRYVLWLIVLLSLTYFQFTAAARRFASWLSIVRDERRFMCHPGLYLGLRLARVLSVRCSSNMISGISSWQKKRNLPRHFVEKSVYYLISDIKMLLIAFLFF